MKIITKPGTVAQPAAQHGRIKKATVERTDTYRRYMETADSLPTPEFHTKEVNNKRIFDVFIARRHHNIM
jgi:hypothetical protein